MPGNHKDPRDAIPFSLCPSPPALLLQTIIGFKTPTENCYITLALISEVALLGLFDVFPPQYIMGLQCDSCWQKAVTLFAIADHGVKKRHFHNDCQ